MPLFLPGARASELMHNFPEERLDASRPGGVQRTFEWIFDYERAQGKSGVPASEQDRGLVNLCDMALPEVVPEATAADLGVLPRHHAVWAKAQDSLRRHLGHGGHDTELLGMLAWRLGREAGKVRRILSDNGISWGFFYDHDPNTPRNASIPDNFVLLPESASEVNQGQLIAPINFDHAYSKESFLLGTCREGEPAWPMEEPNEKNQQDSAKFAQFVAQETYLLEMALGGSSDNEVQQHYEVDEHVTALLMTCLRDTVVLAFRSGYRLEEDPHPMDAELKELTYDLLNMALCMSDE